MNTTFLAGLTAALQGGMKGYQGAKDRARQEALDELQRRKIEEDDVLKRAALDAKVQAAQDRAKAQADLLDEKRKNAEFQREKDARDRWERGWDPKAEDPEARAKYFGLGEAYLKARPGPDLPKDEFGVRMSPNVNEWNKVPADEQTQGYVEAEKDDLLQSVAANQAKLRAEKEAAALKRAEVGAEAKIKVKNAEGPMKDMGDPLLKELNDEQATIDRGQANVAMVVKVVPPGLWTRKTQDALKYLESQDPATAATFSSIDTYYLNERRKQTGAAASVDEDRFIRSTVPNTNDDVRTFLAKSWMTQKMNEYQHARKLAFLAKARNMRGIAVPPIPPAPWTVYRSVDDAIKEMQMQGAAGAVTSKPLGSELD